LSIDLAGSRSFADVRVGALSAQHGVASRLFVTLELLVWNQQPSDALPATLLDLRADLLVRVDGAGEVLLGCGRDVDSAAATRQWEVRSEARVRLAVELSAPQLEAFERLRQGRRFVLAVAYHGLAADHEGRVNRVRGRDQREVGQDEWLDVLNSLHHHRTVLVEIPLPDDASPTSLSASTRELASATTALRQGRVRDAVGACRLALESLAHAVGEDPANYNVADLVRRNPNLDKQARFALLRKSLTVVAHPAHHGDPNATAIEWHYEDAAALITQTAAMLRYYSGRTVGGTP
jgi:hypothetical protein